MIFFHFGMEYKLFVCELGTLAIACSSCSRHILDVNSEWKDKFEILRKFGSCAKYTNYFHFVEAARMNHKHHFFFLPANDCAVLKI